MARDSEDMWQALLRTGESVATEEAYEHGYKRDVRGDLQKYVAFRVADEYYGLPIDDLEEISLLFPTTPVPRTAVFVIGIGNVRGNVIPVVDLPTRLELSATSRSASARVLIVRHDGELYGLVVDEVNEVISIAPESLEEAPGAISGRRAEFIRALARHGGRIIIILDLGTLLHVRDFVPRAHDRERAT